jgi:hypothetical protein
MIQMVRYGLWAAVAVALVIPSGASFSKIRSGSPATLASTNTVSGHYLEARTCDVYTGPCFANGEMGIAGRDAIMAWSIQQGDFSGVDLAGLKVVMVLRGTDTLGYTGIEGGGDVKSLMYVDSRANETQRDALVEFAKQHSGKAADQILRIETCTIAMDLDVNTLVGQLEAGDDVFLATRKATAEDCICRNESAFYEPLAATTQAIAGVTTDGGFSGTGLGSRWSIPGSRTAYMGVFDYQN